MYVFYYLGLNIISIVTLVYRLPYGNIEWSVSLFVQPLNDDVSHVWCLPRSKKLRGERTKSGAEIMTSQDGCRCEL